MNEGVRQVAGGLHGLGAPSDTFFTLPPEWHWYVVLYFFLGGLAGGSFFIAALIDLFGGPRDWPLARLGYYTSFIALLFCPIFLIIDLTRPERFWHMLVQNKTLLPAFKYWSPISVGSWGLTLFGAFATLAVLGALAEDGRLRWSPLLGLRRSPLRVIVALLGGLFGFFLAGYTGVLLSTTNRAVWADTNLIGLLFLVSGATTSAALLTLLGARRNQDSLAAEVGDWWDAAVPALDAGRLGDGLPLLHGAILTANAARVAALIGIVVPLVLHWRARLAGATGTLSGWASAVLVLIGGFLLRTAVIFSAQAV